MIKSLINSDSSIIFLIIIIGLLITLISFIRSYSIKTSGDIIKIEDLDMKVVKKKSTHHNYGSYSNTATYRMFIENVKDNSDKDVFYTNVNTYHKYNKGDIVKVQRVTYKYKNNIFSEIMYAKNEHYDRLQEYLEKNTDVDIEALINKSRKNKRVSPSIYHTIMASLAMVVLVIYILQIFI